jgi:hypothetical protein
MGRNYKRKAGNYDPKKIIIAVEGGKREKQYFDWYSSQDSTVNVVVLAPSNEEDEDGNIVDMVGKVKPHEILERLIKYAEKPENNIGKYDLIYIVFDADKFNEYHEIEAFLEAIRTTKELKAESRNLALSMHCFEFWLLLHLMDYQQGQTWDNCQSLKTHLGTVINGGFNSGIHISPETIAKAINQAKSIDLNNPSPIMPTNPGTKVYLVAEKLLDALESPHP